MWENSINVDEVIKTILDFIQNFTSTRSTKRYKQIKIKNAHKKI